jgi:hypothetical protein
MNFVFIIDTSLSMSQTFDNISFFDIAKSSIRKFVLDREINNYKLSRSKSDKYFLLSLNQNVEDNFLFNWSTNTEHFLCQLNALKITYDFTNIEYAVKKGFQMINFIKKIGQEKHVNGRLFSKIQNSYIILITDGGSLSSNEKIISNCSLKDKNEYIIDNYPNLYKELYRWDHSLFAIVLTDKYNKFESYKALDGICKNLGGKIIPVDNPNSLNDKLNELSNKHFQNNRVYINFNINKFKKKNIITYLEYNGNIDKMNEKWPFPDELIINKDISILPIKNALPFYEFGNIKYNFSLTPEYYDEYEIKDKKFILTILTEGDCWNNLNLADFIKIYKSSLTIDILVSDLKDKKIVKKPFAVISFVFDKELLEFMNDFVNSKGPFNFYKFFDFQNFYSNNKYNIKLSNITNYIKCRFYNLPYYYTEFLSLIDKYKSKKTIDIELTQLQYNLEKYFSIIPFYYIKYIINFLEKNKIKKLLDKFKESIKKLINDNFSKDICVEIDKLYQLEHYQVMKINQLFADNKKKHLEKKALCCSKEVIYNNQNNYYILNKKDEAEEDKEYLNFIDKSFKVDKLSNINKLNNSNSNNNLYNLEINNGYINNINNNYQSNNTIHDDYHEHEYDIEIMGDYRDFYYKNEHLRSYLIPEIEIRYLIKDFFFGNHFIERRNAYTSKQKMNSSLINNGSIQDESIFHYLNDEDNNNAISNTINNNINNLASPIPNNNNNDNKSNNDNNNNNNIDFETSLTIDTQLKKSLSEMKDKPNTNYLNNKRTRDNSMDNIDIDLNESITTEYSSSISSVPSGNIFNDNYSESDGSNNMLLDELSDTKYTSKMSDLLLEDFKNSLILDNKEQKEGIKVSVKYEISKEKLNKWKFQKQIKNLSQELINSMHNDENNIIKVINKIIDRNDFAPDNKRIYNFIQKIVLLCQSYGVNSMILIQLKNMMKSYAE